MLSSKKDDFEISTCLRMESFDLPMTSPPFMEPLSSVRDPYKASYVPDITFKSHTGESQINNLQSLYLDQNNFVQTSSQALDDVSSHSTAFGSPGNIYTCAPGLDHRLFSPQTQSVPHPLSDGTSALYSRDSTRHDSEKNDLSPPALDPSVAFPNHQITTPQFPRPRFPGDQSDAYSFTEHPPYTQNPFVYFQPTPPRIKETTYQTSYSQLYPTANRPFSNVICDPHEFHYPVGDVFPSSPSTRRLSGIGHQPGHDSKARQCLTSADAVDVEGVDDSCRCKNTVEGTKTSVRRFRKWYKDKFAKNLDMNRVDRNMAISLLKDFFLEIRDTRPGKEGNEYEPVTLTTYRNGLRRYFLERKVPPAPDNFDLADKEFDIVNYHLITKRNELKRNGKGNHPNVVESITEEQLEKMWASGAIGTHSPRALLRLQWWLNTIHHGIRGRMAHHDLNIEDFQISRSMEGKLCIEHIKNTAKRKLSVENDSDYTRNKRKCKARMIATDGSERDPVRAFEVYLKHRPPGISSFYLTPKHKPKGDIWFNKVPMGKNSIGRIMREIKAVAGIN